MSEWKRYPNDEKDLPAKETPHVQEKKQEKRHIEKLEKEIVQLQKDIKTKLETIDIITTKADSIKEELTEDFEEEEPVEVGDFPQVTEAITTSAPEFRSIPLNLQVPMVILQPAALLPAAVQASSSLSVYIPWIIKSKIMLIILKFLKEKGQKRGASTKEVVDEINDKISDATIQALGEKKAKEDGKETPRLNAMITYAFENLEAQEVNKKGKKIKKSEKIRFGRRKKGEPKKWYIRDPGLEYLEDFGTIEPL